MTRCYRIRTATRSAADLASKQRISVEAFQTTITVPTSCKLEALITFSSFRIASWRVAVAVTRLTVGEVPVSGLTLITFSSIRFRMAITLSSYKITLIVFRTNTVAVTCLTTVGGEGVSSRSALVTLSSNDVRLTFAMASMFFTFVAE